MERRYLGATIAMAATFALFSHAFSAGLLTKLQQPRNTMVAEARCAVQTLRTRLLDKVNRSLSNGSAEEAQLRVEFNLPAPALAARPVAPMPAAPSMQVKAPIPPTAPVVACSARKLAEVKLPKNFDRLVQMNVDRAMQAQVLVARGQLQSRELQRDMARMQREMARAQREVARAAAARARAAVYQTRLNSHPCPESQSVRVSSDNDGDNVDLDDLSREIQQEVSRSMDVNVRNF